MTQARYELRVFDPFTGGQVAELIDWENFYYVKNINNYHTAQLILDADDPSVPFFDLDAIIEIWRDPNPDRTPQYVTAAQGYRQTVLNDSPVGYWRLGEYTGTVVADETANGLAGTYNAAPTLGQPGALTNDPNTSVKFLRASSQFVNINSVPHTPSMTVEAWFKATASTYGQNGFIIGEASAATAPNMLRIFPPGASDQVRLVVMDSAGTATTLATITMASIGLDPANWCHYVGTYNGITGDWAFYINGVLRASGTTLVARTSTSSAIRLIRNGTNALYMDGWLDEVAVYSSVLSAARVLKHYNAALNPLSGDTIVTQIVPASPYKEAVLLHRTPQWDIQENGRRTFTSYMRGLNDLLSRRAILYPANSSYAQKNATADNVMKAIVRENLTTAGNISTRKSNGFYSCAFTGLSVAPDSSAAANYRGSFPWKNVLEILIEISQSVDCDFEIERVGDSGRTFQFNTFTPRRGQDRSAVITFSPDFGNMTGIVYVESRTEEANVVAVLGQGQESARQVVIRQDSRQGWLDSPWNRIETTRDARNQRNTLDMVNEGDSALKELRMQKKFTFSVLQTDTRKYGVDYNVGDLIRVAWPALDVDLQKKIVSATVTVAKGVEKIVPEFADINS